jgi:hypothetical protein
LTRQWLEWVEVLEEGGVWGMAKGSAVAGGGVRGSQTGKDR